MVETQYFRISPQRYVRTAMGVWLGRYGWIGITVFAAFIAAGFADARYFIVAAALTLIAYPGVLMLVYFNHALTKEAAYGTIPHKIVITDSGIQIVYAEIDTHPTPPMQTVDSDEFAKVEDTGPELKIMLRSGRYDFILIPTEAFSVDDLRKAVRLLSKNV